MLPCYVMLDLETSGGSAQHDRITEIAAVRVEHGVQTRRWSTLVNPGVRIAPFIQQLTGISNAMLRDAPPFSAVAPTLLELLDGAVLVAHNARFDHGFLLHEFERAGHTLKNRTLCTVRLSRALYPQFKSHGLDALMQRHGLQTSARHRAMGDVDVVLQWLALVQAEFGLERLRSAASALLQGRASLPPLLETPIDSIPDTPGVYLMYGTGELPLYIGKSVNLRTRVLSHFQAAARVEREMRILQEVRRIEWQATAGELGALLLESRLVKALQPVFNRQLRRERQLCAWQLALTPAAVPQLELVRMDDSDTLVFDRLYGVYRSRRAALEALRNAADEHGLCHRALGLERGKGACFAHQIGRCRGWCVGAETADEHHERLQQALRTQRLHAWPFPGRIGLREHDRRSERDEVHVFDQWCHIATARDPAELAEAASARTALAFDLDTYRILVQRLLLHPGAAPTLLHLGGETPHG